MVQEAGDILFLFIMEEKHMAARTTNVKEELAKKAEWYYVKKKYKGLSREMGSVK